MFSRIIAAVVLVIALASCKNPFNADPRFVTATPELTALPVDAASVRYMQPYGTCDFGGGNIIFHSGIDIGITGTARPFYSCGDGLVTLVELNTGQGRPGTNYRINVQVSGALTLAYHFEIDGSVPEQERKDNIFVKEGDYVKAGQKLANLLNLGDGAHVDFGTGYNGSREVKCTLLFFSAGTASAFESIYGSAAVERRPSTRAMICE